LPQWYVERQLYNFKYGIRGYDFHDLEGHRMRPMARMLRAKGEQTVDIEAIKSALIDNDPTKPGLQNKDLDAEDDIKAVAAYVAKLAPSKSKASIEGGDVETGKALYAVCTACHGKEAKGQELNGAPDLRTTGDWYLLKQLKKFKNGMRGTHKSDTMGATMRPMAMQLADEQAMKDVIAYIMYLRTKK
jgi:cytochrome c553